MHYLEVLALIKKIEGTRNLHYSIILYQYPSVLTFEVKLGPYCGCGK